MVDVVADDLDDRIREAGNPTPTAADREWAVEAMFQLGQDLCLELYGPGIGVDPPHMLVEVKYRDAPVDLGAVGFITIPLAPSGDVRQAWWDARNDYMIIDLGGTLYHYCDFGEADVAVVALAADSHAHYQSFIRGASDSRTEGVVPPYSQTSAMSGVQWKAWVKKSTRICPVTSTWTQSSVMAEPSHRNADQVLHLLRRARDRHRPAGRHVAGPDRGRRDQRRHHWFRFRVAEEYNQAPRPTAFALQQLRSARLCQGQSLADGAPGSRDTVRGASS